RGGVVGHHHAPLVLRMRIAPGEHLPDAPGQHVLLVVTGNDEVNGCHGRPYALITSMTSGATNTAGLRLGTSASIPIRTMRSIRNRAPAAGRRTVPACY